MPLLKVLSQDSAPLPDMNVPFTWTIVNTFRLDEPANSTQYITEMLAAMPAMKEHWLRGSHGPYHHSVVTAENYRSCSQMDAEAKFSEWIRGFFGPEHLTDHEHILSSRIRPLLAGAELFMLTGDYDGYDTRHRTEEERGARWKESQRVWDGTHPTLGIEADMLDWNEVVAINWDVKTLTLIIMGGE